MTEEEETFIDLLYSHFKGLLSVNRDKTIYLNVTKTCDEARLFYHTRDKKEKMLRV